MIKWKKFNYEINVVVVGNLDDEEEKVVEIQNEKFGCKFY